jgi:energy-converting hydrogenase Eha subunit E
MDMGPAPQNAIEATRGLSLLFQKFELPLSALIFISSNAITSAAVIRVGGPAHCMLSID